MATTVSLKTEMPHDQYDRVRAAVRRPDLGIGVVEALRVSPDATVEVDTGDIITLSWNGGTYQSPSEKHQRTAGSFREFLVLADGTLERI